MSRLLDGAAWPFRGLRLLLGHPAMWVWVLVPTLITMSLFAVAVWAVVRFTPKILGSFWALPAHANPLVTFSWWLIALLMMATFGLLVAVGSYLASGLIATPFLDKLSEQVEEQVRGAPLETTTLQVFLGDLLQSIAHTLLALLIWVTSMASLLVLGFVPVVGPPLELALSLGVSAFLLAREMMDGPMSRRRLGFLHKLRVVSANRWTTMGFGLVVAGLLWIPLLNFVLLPVAVVGGTLLFLDLDAKGLVPPARRG